GPCDSWRLEALISLYSAYPPNPSPNTRLPIRWLSDFEPTSTIVPVASCPRLVGSSLTAVLPRVHARTSPGQTPHASIFIKISPSAGTGTDTSTTRKSRFPYNRDDFIAHTPLLLRKQ